MQELGLDEGGRQAVNSVLEQSTSQVLQHLAQERVPQATEGPNQEHPPQSGCTSYQTNQLHDSNYSDTGTHTGNSPNTLEGSTTHAANLFQYLPDSTQPDHSSEIEPRQASSVPEHLDGLQRQCPPWPTVSPTVVPTSGHIWDGEFGNLMQDEWGGRGEFISDLSELPDWDGPTFNS
jgi:hypothetical protein